MSGIASGQYDTQNYHKQGGSEWDVNGKLVINGTLDASGATSAKFKALTIVAGTGTCVSNAATINAGAGLITSESLTTAAGATQALTITNSVVAVGDYVFAMVAGGTNTRKVSVESTVETAGQFVATLLNDEASNALNGTVLVQFFVVKAG